MTATTAACFAHSTQHTAATSGRCVRSQAISQTRCAVPAAGPDKRRTFFRRRRTTTRITRTTMIRRHSAPTIMATVNKNRLLEDESLTTSSVTRVASCLSGVRKQKQKVWEGRNKGRLAGHASARAVQSLGTRTRTLPLKTRCTCPCWQRSQSYRYTWCTCQPAQAPRHTMTHAPRMTQNVRMPTS